MILDEYAFLKVCSSNAKYWRDKGYSFPPVGGKGGKNGSHTIQVKISDLPPNSNVRVKCKCNTCHREYTNRYGRARIYGNCYNPCMKQQQMLGNTLGKAHKGKPGLSGSNHPRWNPNKRDFILYSRQVHWLTKKTYEKHKDTINPNDFPRTLCGVEGGYQLDHKISIKEGYEKGISPEEISKIENLQMLPWHINRTKAA